jgi:hypothetical protein
LHPSHIVIEKELHLLCVVEVFTPKFLVWRAMQCFRRYYDHRLNRDLVNASKYGTSLAVIWFAGLYNGLESGHWGPFKILWVIFAVGATLFGSIWDIWMDAGVGRVHFKMLRRNVILPRWTYYVAMPSDLALRCAWLFTVAPSPFDNVYVISLALMLALVEVGRRVGWNVFRLANEHTQNALQLKVLGDDLVHIGDTYETEVHESRKVRIKDAVPLPVSANHGMETFSLANTSEDETSHMLLDSENDR